jgi:hypothetical protein
VSPEGKDYPEIVAGPYHDLGELGLGLEDSLGERPVVVHEGFGVVNARCRPDE